LFGWQIDQKSDAGGGYWMISHQGTPIGGIIQMPASVRNATGEWICSVSVTDVDGVAGKATANGASILLAPTNFDGRGRSALIRDPQGAPVALLRTEKGDPVRVAASDNGWLWAELWSQNMAGSVQFYEQVFGAVTERKRDGQRDYILLKNSSGKEMAGIVASPVANVRSHWVNYVKVADPVSVVRRAQELGARVLLEPRADVRNGSLGVFLDPTGAPVAVQRYPIK
jgi:predicted enzyme related to lactoylglutathione lyase